MDISLIPLCIYKIPKNCNNLLITPNLMFTIIDHPSTQESHDILNDITNLHNRSSSSSHTRSAAGFSAAVVASNTSELRIGEDSVELFTKQPLRIVSKIFLV